jgi:hypothetical protein
MCMGVNQIEYSRKMSKAIAESDFFDKIISVLELYSNILNFYLYNNP